MATGLARAGRLRSQIFTVPSCDALKKSVDPTLDEDDDDEDDEDDDEEEPAESDVVAVVPVLASGP